MPTSYDTIVVGLGSAGAAAASTLAKAGKRVLGLEAQNRIGGRVKTVRFGDGIVEEGAEWIHGTKNNTIYEVAVKNNITLIRQDMPAVVFHSNNTIGDSSLVNELVDFCKKIMRIKSDEPETMGNYITKRLKDYLKENHPYILKDEDFVTEFLEMMNLIINNEKGTDDWNDVSAYTAYEELKGRQDLSWHRHGYETYFDILLHTYDNGPGLLTLDIKLNKEVTSIKWSQDSAGKGEVVCKDGDVYTADHVIVTVSLGVLKERHSTLFSPPLPKEKINIIDKMAIGYIGKIILKFEKQWLPHGFSILFFWRREEKKRISKEDYWITRIYMATTPMGSSNTISFWTSGDCGKMVETLPEEIVMTKLMKLLRKFVGKSATMLKPTGMIRSTWFTNPFTRGSYSYDNIFVQENPNARSILAEPLVDGSGTPRVLFAGEATDVKHYANVHGASDSGYREAKRILSKNNGV